MKKVAVGLGILTLVLVLVQPALAVDYGSSPDLDNSWKGLPVCGEAKPKAPILYEPNNPALPKAKNPGEVRLQWTKVPQARGYNVYFGLSPRNYIYSAADVGDTDNYTVRFLGNRTYYFAVQSKGDCAIGPVSNEWAGRPGGGGAAMVTTSAFVPVQRQNAPENTPQTQEGSLQQENVRPQAPKAAPAAPSAPKAKAAPASGGFLQSLFSFFGGLFGRK